MDSYKNPKPGMTYVGPSHTTAIEPDRTVRVASKLIDSPTTYTFATIKGEVVLQHKGDAKTHVKATFYSDNREIVGLTLQRYTLATGRPRSPGFSFPGAEVAKLLEFVTNIQSLSFKGTGAVRVADDEVQRIDLSSKQAQSLVLDNEDLFATIVRSAITKQDIVAVGYRKKQLEVFEKLLSTSSSSEEIEGDAQTEHEAAWQNFFEKNPWIFGYGLSFIYRSSLDTKKLEQFVQGHHVGTHGKRVDALLKSRGAISSLCFVEIKTPTTPLVGTRPYRAGCWAPSTKLAGAISQIQGTVAAAMNAIYGQLSSTNAEGFPTGEQAFNYAPKAYLVVGSLSQFVGNLGVNQDQYRSFELLRRNTTSPEIITFDELFERAKFIVRASEG